ncbi:MAG TPA: TetR/AcrR family transcriptional regulator [Actinocrinis sp.]|jgi:AcrR family transcriptional regulator
MRGRVPPRPLKEIGGACVRVFLDKGYRTAGITDVAKALGLSHGAIYTYADSKQALLYLALVRVLEPEALETMDLPVKLPEPDRIVATVDRWAARQSGLDLLTEPPRRPDPGGAEQELGEVVEQIYDFIDKNRVILRLFERCSEDLPVLTQWYFVERRRGLLAALGEFLNARIEAGLLRPVPDVPTAARFIVETIAWFAMHRHGDPDSAMLTDEDCRRTVRHLVPAAFLPSGEPR